MAETSKGKPGRQAELALVKSAIAKRQAGNAAAITSKEQRAFERWESAEDERRGRRFLEAVPKKLYCELSGRQVKVLNEQADAFGVPLRGATINLLEVVRWLHDFFAKHKHELPHVINGEGGPTCPKDQLVLEQIEVYRRRVVLLEQKIAREAATLIPRVEIHQLLAQLAKVLRGAGDRLHKQYGDQAASILDAALCDFEATIEQLETKSDESVASLEDAVPAND